MSDDLDAYLEHARQELGPKMASSAFVVTINPAGEIDPKIALETGYAILLDKPILVVASPGQPVKPGLRRIATRVLELTAPLETDRGGLELMAAIAQMRGEIGS